MPAAAAAWVSGQVFALTASTVAADIALVGSYVAATAALSYGLSEASAKLAASQVKDGSRVAARDFPVISGKAPETVVYGEAWTSGVIMYAASHFMEGSKDNWQIHKAFIHAGHECEDITDLFYDNDLVTAANIDWASSPTHIIGGKYAVNRTINGTTYYAVSLEKHLGSSTQAQSDLLSAAYPDDFPPAAGSPATPGVYRARGYCYTVHEFNYFSKTSKTAEGIFFSGVPENVRAKVKGKRIYDPRGDSTNGGSGPYRFNDPTTWVWSDNPILCLCDYLTQYMGVGFSEIAWDWVITQAPVCEVFAETRPTGTQHRYSCNGVLSLAASHGDNRDAILGSCLGTLPYINGKFYPTAGDYIAADVTLTDADVVQADDGGVTFTASFPREERYNTVNSVYYSANDYAQEVDSLPVTASAYVTRDGGVTIPKTLRLPMVNDEFQAQRICYKHLAQSDRQKTVVVKLRWTGLQIQPGTRVSFTYTKHNWVNKTFRCIDFAFGDSSPIQVTLREDDSAGWADPLRTDLNARDAQGAVTLHDIVMPTPTAGAGSVGEITIQNANFEAGADINNEAHFWEHLSPGSGAFEIIQDAGLAHQGNWVCRAVGNINDGIANYVRAPCNPAMRVAFGGYLSTTSDWDGPGGNGRAQFLVQFLADDGTTEISSSTTPVWTTANAPWVMVRTVAVAPANTHFVRFFLIANQTAGHVYYDDTFMSINVGVGQEVGVGITVSSGSGSPEGVVTAPVGSIYLRTDGSTSTTFYVKTSGTGNTGWTAK